MFERSIIHLNVADFAVAVERLEDSTLREKPLLIASGSTGRTTVYDMSEEAYQDGVRKGMYLHLARRYCRRAKVLQPQPLLYRKAMQALVTEVRGYSPRIEQGGMDGHLFIDVSGTHRLFGPPPDIAWRLRKQLSNCLGIRPIWTVASNKLVSKVASRLVKPLGEYIVGPGEEDDFLAPLPLELLPGVTKQERGRMDEFNLQRIGQLAGLNKQQLIVLFGKGASYLYEASRGIDRRPVCAENVGSSRIRFEEIFADDTCDRKFVESKIRNLAACLCRELREKRLETGRVLIELHYSDGRSSMRQAVYARGSNNDFVVEKLALTGLKRAWSSRSRLRSCVVVCDRLRRCSAQLSLFCGKSEKELQREKIIKAMDSIRNRFGHDSICLGGRIVKSTAEV